ncbi:hypothetical protein D5P86_00130 [Salmonella enterica subsp. enterica serovar Infantis]|nr:hypothetical protein [Salmonella enterica subsp. enterica serovar Infantis]
MQRKILRVSVGEFNARTINLPTPMQFDEQNDIVVVVVANTNEFGGVTYDAYRVTELVVTSHKTGPVPQTLTINEYGKVDVEKHWKPSLMQHHLFIEPVPDEDSCSPTAFTFN